MDSFPARCEDAFSSGVQSLNKKGKLKMKSNLVVVERWLCLNIEEATAEVEACKAYVVYCETAIPKDRGELKMAKAALRSAERELRDWQRGVVPPLAEPQLAMVACAGR